MKLFKISLFSIFAILLPSISIGAESIDVEQCTKEKKAKYSNMYQQCFPVVAICWGWGAGEDAVYEYCNADKITDRISEGGTSTNIKDKGDKKRWACTGDKSDC